jgi:hypothetical protein
MSTKTVAPKTATAKAPDAGAGDTPLVLERKPLTADADTVENVAYELEGLADVLVVAGASDERLNSDGVFFLERVSRGLAARLRDAIRGASF